MKHLKKYSRALIAATVVIAALTIYECTPGKASNAVAPGKKKAVTASTASENMAGVIVLTDNSFDEKIKKGLVLVDFWAVWCRPCRIQAPILDEVSALMNGKAMIGKLDIDQNPKIRDRYFIQSIPTMLLFKDGKVVKTFVGVTSKEVIVAEMNKFIK